MRLLLPALAFVLMPGLASAQCVCSCLAGRSIPVCAQPALVEPICQQVCIPKLEQSLGPQGGGGAGGGMLSGNLPTGIDASTLNNPGTMNPVTSGVSGR